MLGIKQTWMTLLLKVRRIPKKYIIPTAATIALIGGYVAVFVIERPVTLSYAAQTCVSSLTFFPSTHTTSENAAYAVSHTNTLKIGGVTLAAGDVCFTPLLAPTSGVVAKVHLSPFGGVVARQIFAVLAPPPVSVSARALSVPIPTSKPLHLQLSGPDIIFSYSLSANHKKVPCAKRDAAVVCDVPKLELAQGRDYAAVLHRQFADSSTATVLSRDIQTLSATTVTDSSVKANDVIYNKPQEFHFQFDKNLKSVDATVVRVEGDVRTEITSTAGVSGSSATIKLAEDLPRLKDIELRIDAVEAVDGSDLMEPYVTAVKTSGGPKVTGVNVSSTGIPMGALVAVTFDQALSG